MKSNMFKRLIFVWIFICGFTSIGFSAPIGSSGFTGEKVYYDIKNLGLKAGDATIEFKGRRDVGGKKAELVVFTAKAFIFFDEEKIYIDPVDFFPIRVERDLNIFGKKEKIVEFYDSAKGIVRIVKTVKGKTTEQVLKKEGKLDNIYAFIYRYRMEGGFELGDKIGINLPTKDVEMSLLKKNKIKTAGKIFDTFYMQSTPKKYRVWFGASGVKIPLRIDGAVGFGSTSMIMSQYSKDL